MGTPTISVEINGQKYAFKEIGGHRDERKRWSTYSKYAAFGNSLEWNKMDCCLFTIDLCGYNCLCFEDSLRKSGKNKMIDSIELFHEVCDENDMQDCHILLLLTFKDQFKQKLMDVPLTECWIFKDMQLSDGFIENASVFMSYFLNKWYCMDMGLSSNIPKNIGYLIGVYVNIGKFCIDEYFEECLSFIKQYFAELSEDKLQSVTIYALNTLNTNEVENIIRRIGR